MQIKINRNFIWSNIIVDQLAECGIKYACISPGSRSTPITYSISLNKKIRSFVHVDERVSGFFALGLAKKSNSPVMIITTSGTATAELYPAIIEAYQNRVPLIICTADRPSYLRNTGTNQTINQENIYKNHIRFFYDTGLPKLDSTSIKKLKSTVLKAFSISDKTDRGPVHLNLPFEKPLEPDSYTDSIEENILLETLAQEIPIKNNGTNNPLNKKSLSSINSLLKKSVRGLITVGSGNFDQSFLNLLNEFSIRFSLPVFADATSGMRFNGEIFSNLIVNYDSLLRSELFIETYKPKYILHFGRPLTSPRIENIFKNTSLKVFIVNNFGDFSFKQTADKKIMMDEKEFLSEFIAADYKKEQDPLIKAAKDIDELLENIKSKIFFKAEKINEVQVLCDVLDSISPNSNIMIGNSVPVRDLDFLSSSLKKKLIIHQNRGASGIDGIIATSAGISTLSKIPTYLVIGDLSFYYDLNSLLTIKQLQIPLVIILINNSGGSIFKFLPIAKHKKILDRYFLTPTHLEFGKIVEAFGIDYKEIKTTQELIKHLKVSGIRKQPAVFEIKTNSDYSLSLRKKYWKMAESTIDDYLRKYEV